MRPTARARQARDLLQPRQDQFATLMGTPHTLGALRATLDVVQKSRAAIDARRGSETE